MFTHILVATDGSAAGGRAVAAAAEIAALMKAKVTVLHVLGEGEPPESLMHLAEIEHLVDPPRPEPRNVADIVGNLALMESAGEDAARRYRIWASIGDQIVKRAVAALRDAGVEDVDTCLEEGDAAERIVERARERAADLVVLGRRGLSDLEGLLLGSVSHKVCQLVDSAVLTIR